MVCTPIQDRPVLGTMINWKINEEGTQMKSHNRNIDGINYVITRTKDPLKNDWFSQKLCCGEVVGWRKFKKVRVED